VDGSKATSADKGANHRLAIQQSWVHPNDGCEVGGCPNANWNNGLHALGV